MISVQAGNMSNGQIFSNLKPSFSYIFQAPIWQFVVNKMIFSARSFEAS